VRYSVRNIKDQYRQAIAISPSLLSTYTVKKGFAIFPSPAGMSLIKLSLDGNNLIISAQGEFGQ
jgi:hypothetical protein